MTDIWEPVARFLGVVLVDLLLAGDNAVVIALAARRLRGNLRRQAILFGAAGAVGLRLLLAAAVSWLLHVPLLQALGGLLLLWIAWKLVHDDRGGHEEVEAASSVLDAVRIIIMADVVMSLDNVLALVGVSGGHLELLVLGLALSVPLIIWGSSLLSALMDRWPWLVFAGAGILVRVAFEMVLEDRIVHQSLVGVPEPVLTTAHVVMTLLFIAAAWWLTRPEPAASLGPAGGGRGPGHPAGREPGDEDDASKQSR